MHKKTRHFRIIHNCEFHRVSKFTGVIQNGIVQHRQNEGNGSNTDSTGTGDNSVGTDNDVVGSFGNRNEGFRFLAERVTDSTK